MTIKGSKITLRDVEYTLSPLTIDQCEAVWPQVCKVVQHDANSPGAFEKLPGVLDAAADVILAAMRSGNYPEMTKEKLRRDVLDYGNWKDAFFATLAVSSIRLSERKPGEAPALSTVVRTGTESDATSPAPSGGPSSTSAR
jgi:hypothetical protein